MRGNGWEKSKGNGREKEKWRLEVCPWIANSSSSGQVFDRGVGYGPGRVCGGRDQENQHNELKKGHVFAYKWGRVSCDEGSLLTPQEVAHPL